MEKIVVGIDGSPASMEALKWAVGEARLRGAGLLVVQSWEFPALAEASLSMMPIGTEVLDELRRAAEETTSRALAAVDTSGLKVTTTLVEGSAAQMLLEAAEGADLLVVGSRGLGGFKGLLLGSVSQQCAQHAPCPIVIVRAGSDDPTG